MAPSLLLIDDDEDLLTGLTHFFSAQGWDVEWVREKEEAEALLSHKRYSAVVADMHLSALRSTDGLDIISLARSRSPSTRVVVLTANESAAVEEEALRRGADAYLRKPMPLPTLEALLSRLLGRGE